MEGGGSFVRSMPEMLLSVSCEDFVKEQASDPKLQELFTQVVSEEDLSEEDIQCHMAVNN